MSRLYRSRSGGLFRLTAGLLLLALLATSTCASEVHFEEFDDDWDLTTPGGGIMRVPRGYKQVKPPLNPPRVAPKRGSFDNAVQKLQLYKKSLGADTGSAMNALNALNVVLYDVQDVVDSDDALQLTLNNIRVFATAVLLHSETAPIKAFYLFNVASSSHNPNPATALLPLHLPNVVAVDWGATHSAFDTHLRSLKLLDESGALEDAASVFCTGSSVRPLLHVRDAEWLADFRGLLGGYDSCVGLVGAEARCDGVPVALTHAFMLRPDLVRSLVDGMAWVTPKSQGRLVPTADHLMKELSALVRKQGFQVASMLHHVRYGQASPSDCSAAWLGPYDKKEKDKKGKAEVCASQPEEVLLLHWSGASLGTEGFMCSKSLGMSALKGRVQELTLALGQSLSSFNSSSTGTEAGMGTWAHGALRPVLPEQLVGGALSILFAEYELERARLTTALARSSPSPLQRARETSEQDQAQTPQIPQARAARARVLDVAPYSAPADSSVCFLVRTSKMHDPQYVHKPPMQKYLHMDLDVIVQSLLAQTNPNWLAFFFVTDPSQFDRRLARILHRYADPRLVPLDVEMKFRPVFTKIDGGYTTTDHVLRQILGKPECRWISATNGDNAYGSELVDRVINSSGGSGGGSGSGQADMILAPMDSRNFADQDNNLRRDFDWDRRCLGIKAVLALSGLAYTASPVPKIARVDLAAIFLRRAKLLAENVWFGNFSDAKRFHCLGCNDGYFTQYLVRNRGWTYTRLPIDGLRSVMFHGPSPTHCIAAGNVWFDHQKENRVGCLHRELVQRMLRKDLGRQYGTPPQVPYFDWDHYNTSDRVCLRLSRYGHENSDMSMKGGRRLQAEGGGKGLEVWEEGEGGEEGEEAGGGAGVNTGDWGLYPSHIRTYRPPEEQWLEVQRALQTQTTEPRRHSKLLDPPEPVEQCVWRHYLLLNPDLVSFTTEEQASEHFERLGRKENRECAFDWKHYLQRNPDVEKAGLDTEALALQHYVNIGKREGRFHSTAEERYKCDWRVYPLLNPDLGITQAQAAEHYHASGRMEGRECRFDYKRYLQLNTDLEAGGVKTEQQAVTHYLTIGRREHRLHNLESFSKPSTLANCSARSYLLLNPDLQNVVPEADAMKHYQIQGQKDKRECGFDWKQYLAYNEDLFGVGVRTESAALSHYVTSGRKEGRVFTPARAKVEGFEWMHYLEANLDLVQGLVKIRHDAIMHFNRGGFEEGRRYTMMTPAPASWALAVAKLRSHLRNGASMGKQNLVIYNIVDIGSSDVASDITLNNVRTFVTAILHHVEAEAAGESPHKAFYLFNVAALTDNPALGLLPLLPNVAVVHWTFSSSSLYAFLHTLRMLGTSITSALDAVFHLNSGVRGPLAHFQGGRWISQYRDLLDGAGVGLVGSIIDCHKTPYVQPHAFALRGSLIYSLLQELDKYYSSMVFVPMEDYFRFRLKAMVQEQGQQVASLQHSRRTGLRYFTSCPADSGNGSASDNDSSVGTDALAGFAGCVVDPEVVLFLRWSGEAMGAPDFLCGKAVAMNPKHMAHVQQLTLAVTKAPLSSPLPRRLLPTLPEAPTDMILYDEFRKETALPRPPAPQQVGQKTQVCVALLVGGGGGGGRGVSGDARGSHAPSLNQASLANTVQSLQQQQNPNWRAFLVPEPGTPPSPLMAQAQDDPRVVLLDLDLGQGSGAGVGGGAVMLVRVLDDALRHLAGRPECLWVSAVRQGDMYGSSVVASVLSSAPLPPTASVGEGVTGVNGAVGGRGGNVPGGGQAAILLAPLDSHKFAEEDYANRYDTGWDRRCIGLESTLVIQGNAYVKQLAPRQGDFDLAGAFMQSSWLGREPLGLANFSQAAAECARAQPRGARRLWAGLGCAAEQLAQHLVRGGGSWVGGSEGGGWTYARLPQDALRSVVFQAPSPTRCVAQGDVWLDHPCPEQAGCLSHLNALRLWRVETAPGQNESIYQYDWGQYYAATGSQVCLRLSQFGFHAQRCRGRSTPA